MTDLAVRPDETVVQQFENLLVQLQETAISSDNYVAMMGILLQCKTHTKFYEQHRDQALNPTKQTASTIKGWFSPILNTLGQVEQLIKDKATTYLGARQGSRLTAAAAGQKPLAPDEPVEGISVREVWTFKVINKDLLTADFLKVDEPAIRENMKQLMTDSGPTALAGVKFFRKISVAVSPPKE